MEAGSHSIQSTTFPTHPLPLRGAQQQDSPASSTTNSPGNVSPSSPRSQNKHQLHYHLPGHVRQLRPPKSPLYVPAALRPTEKPNKISSPITPPKSVRGSAESLEDQARGYENASVDSAVSLPPHASAAHDWITYENLGQVIGEPTKEHWKADAQSPQCDSPACHTSFNLFNLNLLVPLRRRHHCRHCGHIFCSEHTLHSAPLDQHARFHPDGHPSRACDTCYRHYRQWDAARRSRIHTASAHDQHRDTETEAEIEQASGGGGGGVNPRAKGRPGRPFIPGPGPVSPFQSSSSPSRAQSEQNVVVGSVSREWSWSTF